MPMWLINIISGLLILAIYLLVSLFEKKNNKIKLNQVRLICLSGILVALAVTLHHFEALIIKNVPKEFKRYFRIEIGNFILVLIGFINGAMLGIISGIASDVVGLIMRPTSPCLFFTLTSILWCILPYYLVKMFSKVYYYQYQWSFYLYLLIAYALTSLLIYSTTPLVVGVMYNIKSLSVLYLNSIIRYPFNLTINITMIIKCYWFLTKVLNLQTQFQSSHFIRHTKTHTIPKN